MALDENKPEKDLADVDDLSVDMQKIHELIDSGTPITEIAKMYKVTRSTIYYWLKNDGKRKKRGRKPMTEEEKAAWHEAQKNKTYSMNKPEFLVGGAMQSLDKWCNATNEEISQLMSNVVKWYELGKIAPVKTDEECAERIDAYFNYIIRTGEKPSVEKLALSLGVTVRSLEYWKNGERGSKTRQAMINYAIQTLAAMDAELVNNNKIPQVTYIFRSKNFFNMRDQTEVIHHSTRQEIDEEELRRRILQNVIMENAEDGEFEDV